MRPTALAWGVAGLGALGLTLLAGWWQVDGPGSPVASGLSLADGAAQQDERPMALTDMAFRLTDQEGNSVGPGTLTGRPSMVFFGFTYCPDVCPTTLSDISVWLDAMGEDAEQLNTIFITVDPERDTEPVLAEYVGYFHPAIRGWTGPADEIDRAADAFGVIYERVPTDNGDYTMKHTASIFLFDASGRFVSTIDYHEPSDTAVLKLSRIFPDSSEKF